MRIRLLMSMLSVLVLPLISFPVSADIPDWLGADLEVSTQLAWETTTNEQYVDFIPRNKYPKVWVLVSRKANSYDTALATMLNVFRRELGNATFRVFLLPATDDAIIRWTKLAESKADLIYTVGSKATVQLHELYAGQRLPVVSVNAKDPVLLGLTNNYLSSNNNFAFTSLNLPADITLNFLLKFKPELSQIGVLYAKKNTSAYLTQYLPLKKEAQKRGIEVVTFEVDESQADSSLEMVMQSQVKQMQLLDPNQSILWLTGSSSLLDRIDEINQLAEGIPLLTVVPDAVNNTEQSALMSVGVSFENNAHQAALYGVRILRDGVLPRDLPVGVLSPPDISINFKQAEAIKAQIPFVLIEMASDLYAPDGNAIRAAGMTMRGEIQ
ncbi:hypothetical protein L4D77_20040 [Photobacterium frigidiphilum]|uniref:ABC transporter substrate binding protein n=1 Tax=Photobacterium frigidiphilum TaxID=264736 RepID=UPI003D0B64A1